MTNGETHVHDEDWNEMAFALVDRTLTAIGGLETTDPMRALDIVLAMYERARERLSV
ncbi:MAG: hypothetical protein NVSMB19_05230 [Vulcanimicrobiaceae bacterium]